jgi:hypothetical protein
MLIPYSIFKFRNQDKYICFGQISYETENKGINIKPIVFQYMAKNNFIARARFWTKEKNEKIDELKKFYQRINFINYKKFLDNKLFFNPLIGDEAVNFLKKFIISPISINKINISEPVLNNNIIEDYSYIEYDINDVAYIKDDFYVFEINNDKMMIKRKQPIIMLTDGDIVHKLIRPNAEFINNFSFVSIISIKEFLKMKKFYEELEKNYIG